MTHREADIRIAPVDHRGTYPSRDVTHSNRMGFVNDYWVAQGVRHWGLNQGINADDQILRVGQEAKLELKELQHPQPQSGGGSDAQYIHELPQQKSSKLADIGNHMSEKSIHRIVTPHDNLLIVEICHHKGVVIRPIWLYSNTFGESLNELAGINAIDSPS